MFPKQDDDWSCEAVCKRWIMTLGAGSVFYPFAATSFMAIMDMSHGLCSNLSAERKRGLTMKSVNIAELKNRLSVYINDVKAGEEILVRTATSRWPESSR